MRFCEKCGKEIPDEATECTCCYEQEVSENTTQTADEFPDAIKDSKITNILGIVVLLLGIVSVLFINGWLGAVLFFVAEIFVLVPNSKVQKLCKTKDPEADKKAKQAFLKETTKRLKSEDKNFKFSFIIGYVCLACLILSFIVPSPIISAKSNSENGNNSAVTGSVQSSITESEQSINEQDDDLTTDDSDSSGLDGYAVEPIVGGFEYYESVDLYTATPVATPYPHASYLHFAADGTGNVSIKTNSSDGLDGLALYETTWEFVGIEENMRKYAVYTHTNDTLYVYYTDNDTCIMFTTSAINTYERVMGNAQENVSGITTSSVYDIANTSFNFAYTYDPETKNKSTSTSLPYVNSLVFGSGNMFFAYLKITPTSDNPYGIGTLTGEWSYEKTDDEFYFYEIDFDEGYSWEVIYWPEKDICMMTDTSGIVTYFELGERYGTYF